MYRDKFVLSVIHDGHPVHETGHGVKEVAIPFNSEYKIRLKNKHSRSCTARVFVDGRKVSELGDFIIGGGGTIDLERFVDRSLLEGKKFKFVSLDHDDVSDPTSSDNGLIKVEFRLAKQQNGIKIKWNEPNKWPEPPVPCPWPPKKYKGGTADVQWEHYTSNDTTAQPRTLDGATWYFEDGGSTNSGMKCNSFVGSVRNVNYCAQISEPMAAPGATIEGGNSNQSFVYSDLEVDNLAVILQLKIVGLSRPSSSRSSECRYCSQCGNKMKRADRFCSECGRRV